MKKAIVIHSGGMDSSLCLALAIKEFKPENVLSLSFSYEQRHSNELIAAAKISADWGVDHDLINIDVLSQVTDNALINTSQTIESSKDSMVLGRNGLMARLGAIYAHHLGAHYIYMGVMELETSYRDCSRKYMDLMEQVLQIDLADSEFKICTPLINMTKAETMQLAFDEGVLDYLLENTITCYQGIKGEGCRTCPACILKKQGILDYQASLISQGSF